MSDQRILSAEQLAHATKGRSDPDIEALSGHIAALTEQHAAELARVTKERDEQTKFAGVALEANLILQRELAALKAERAEDVERLVGKLEYVKCLTDVLTVDHYTRQIRGMHDLMDAIETAIDAARAAGKDGE